MIDVLFKAKVKDENDPMNGEWVQGYFVALHFAAGQESLRIYTGMSDMDCGTCCPEWHEIYPDTVCQYVRKNDRDRTKIFEWDIIQCGNEVLRVVRKSGRVVALKSNMRPMSWQYVETCGKVIGNVFDNPELLEEK